MNPCHCGDQKSVRNPHTVRADSVYSARNTRGSVKTSIYAIQKLLFTLSYNLLCDDPRYQKCKFDGIDGSLMGSSIFGKYQKSTTL